MRRLLKIVAIALAVIVAIPLVVIAVVLIGGNTQPGRDLIARQIGALTGGSVTISGLSGRFPDRLRIAHLELHDTKGAYAVAGYTATKSLAPRYGVEIVKDEDFEMTTSDFSPLFTHLKGSGAQAFVFWGTGPSGVTVTKQYAAANLKIPLFMTPSQASKLWLEPVGAAGEGVSVLSAIGVVGEYLPDGPQKRVISEMAEPFQQKYGYAPPQFAQDGYSACLLLFEAMKKANSAKRDQIRDTLEQLTLLTPNGQYRYSKTDHSGLTREFISVNVVQGGKFVPTPWAKEQLVRTVAAE